MKLEDLQVYQLAMALGDKVWKNVSEWDYFSKETVGKQLVRSTDSIAANISEGFGRFFYKENRQFCYYSRGSLYEVKTWLNKSHSRNLITDDENNKYLRDINTLSVKLNNYIKTIGKKKVGSNDE